MVGKHSFLGSRFFLFKRPEPGIASPAQPDRDRAACGRHRIRSNGGHGPPYPAWAKGKVIAEMLREPGLTSISSAI